MPNNPLWHAAHYNALAKEIRELFPLYDEPALRIFRTHARSVLTELALSLALRFRRDNESFDPLHFLDACSPDPDMYPLSELWEK